MYPKRILPWLDSPQLREQICRKSDRTDAFTSRPLPPSDIQVNYIVTNIQNRPIYSEASLRNFERDTVGNFVEKVIKALRDDEPLRHEFGIQGRVTFYARANPSETSLEKSLEQMNLQDTRSSQRQANNRHGRGRGRGRGAAQRQKRDGTTQRRNRRADQFCVHLVADERQIPVYAVEFKMPHKVSIPELVTGLHQMDLTHDVIDREGDTFEFYATRLVAAVVTQIFSYMIDSGTYAQGKLLLSSISQRMNPQLFNISCVSRIKTFRRTMNCASTGPPSVRCLRSPFKRWPPKLRLKSGTMQH
ncbi:hypothetical protein VN97_g12331 [Penicillium thymicola]|uniref:Uncharacterized protein n=1 Tax=Penicillium thymicola TaxID=293382 RepID=A0AAI9X2P1_PENTH|nr:hypothetical protein VN97_g12331 [Penicillium thymicola]